MDGAIALDIDMIEVSSYSECRTCQCPLTVKHILVECVDLKDVQNKHFVASSIKDLFDNIEAHKIIDFIKETRFYKQL